MSAKNTQTIGLQETGYPAFSEHIPPLEIREGRYVARFIRSADELDQILQLRFRIFNLELGEGLDSSFLNGRDEDRYDISCHHLVVFDSSENRPVGTYRIQSSSMAAAANGFYSAGEFDLGGLTTEVIDNAVELGRACILPEHRNTQVLFLLWKGLAAYVTFNRKRFLFGCCSLTSQDPDLGVATYDHLRDLNVVHSQIDVEPRDGAECKRSQNRSAATGEVTLPRLFRTYLRFGAKVCSRAAIDRDFKTIDFLVLFDIDAMDEVSRRLFFSE